jgi:hypothetical protein
VSACVCCASMAYDLKIDTCSDGLRSKLVWLHQFKSNQAKQSNITGTCPECMSEQESRNPGSDTNFWQSTSANTIDALLPPHSSCTFVRLPAASLITACPAAVDPVNATCKQGGRGDNCNINNTLFTILNQHTQIISIGYSRTCMHWPLPLSVLSVAIVKLTCYFFILVMNDLQLYLPCRLLEIWIGLNLWSHHVQSQHLSTQQATLLQTSISQTRMYYPL